MGNQQGQCSNDSNGDNMRANSIRDSSPEFYAYHSAMTAPNRPQLVHQATAVSKNFESSTSNLYISTNNHHTNNINHHHSQAHHSYQHRNNNHYHPHNNNNNNNNSNNFNQSSDKEMIRFDDDQQSSYFFSVNDDMHEQNEKYVVHSIQQHGTDIQQQNEFEPKLATSPPKSHGQLKPSASQVLQTMNADAEKTVSKEERLTKFYEILDCTERLHGKRSYEVAVVCHRMCEQLRDLNRFEEAYKWEARYFECIPEKASLDYAESLLLLGDLVWEMGSRYSEAIHYYLAATVASRKLEYYDEWDFKLEILKAIEAKSKAMKRMHKVFECFLIRALVFHIKREFLLLAGDLRFEELPILSQKLLNMHEGLYLTLLLKKQVYKKCVNRLESNDMCEGERREKGEEEEGREQEGESCSICFLEFNEGDGMKILTCKHHFHGVCIDHWILRHQKCPVCRKVETCAQYAEALDGLATNIRNHHEQTDSFECLESRILDRVLAEKLLSLQSEDPSADNFMFSYTNSFRAFQFLIPSLPLLPNTPRDLAFTFLSRSNNLERKATAFYQYNLPVDAEKRDRLFEQQVYSSNNNKHVSRAEVAAAAQGTSSNEYNQLIQEKQQSKQEKENEQSNRFLGSLVAPISSNPMQQQLKSERSLRETSIHESDFEEEEFKNQSQNNRARQDVDYDEQEFSEISRSEDLDEGVDHTPKNAREHGSHPRDQLQYSSKQNLSQQTFSYEKQQQLLQQQQQLQSQSNAQRAGVIPIPMISSIQTIGNRQAVPQNKNTHNNNQNISKISKHNPNECFDDTHVNFEELGICEQKHHARANSNSTPIVKQNSTNNNYSNNTDSFNTAALTTAAEVMFKNPRIDVAKVLKDEADKEQKVEESNSVMKQSRMHHSIVALNKQKEDQIQANLASFSRVSVFGQPDQLKIDEADLTEEDENVSQTINQEFVSLNMNQYSSIYFHL